MTDRRRKFRILVVEDSRPTQVWIANELETCRNGFEFELVFAETLAEALPYVLSVDAVVLDLTLPDSEGPETLKTVRDQCDLVPIVVYTGDDRPEMWFEAGRQLASGVVTKDHPLAPNLSCMIGQASRLQDGRDQYLRRLQELHNDPQVFQQ